MLLTTTSSRGDSAIGVTQLLAAGLAVATVGVLHTGLITSAVAQVQHRAVRLINSSDWSEVLNTAQHNLDLLQDEFTAQPFPVLTQIGDNLADYAQLIAGMDDVQIGFHSDGSIKTNTSGLAGLAAGWQQTVSTGFDNGTEAHPHIPGLLDLPQDVLIHFQEGDPVQAFSDINTWMLDSLEVLLKPLEPVVTIPQRILENYTNLVSEFFGPTTLWDFGKGAVKALTEPLIGVEFQISEFAAQLQSAMADGDTETVLGDAPAQLADALLNGYRPPGADESFIGLLSPDGTLQSVLVTWPRQIADALTVGTVDLHALTPADGVPDLLTGF